LILYTTRKSRSALPGSRRLRAMARSERICTHVTSVGHVLLHVAAAFALARRACHESDVRANVRRVCTHNCYTGRGVARATSQRGGH
jgi:hypothetical protein